MTNRVISTVFSLSGASIAIGVTGFMSSLATIFIDVNTLVSIKWLLFSLVLFLSLALILSKVIYDLSLEVAPPPPFEVPIRYVPEEQVFVIRRNENFVNNIVVGCYAQHNEIDRLAYLGVVHLVQDKVIQIKIRSDLGVLEKIPETLDELKSIIVRPVVPVTAIQQFNGSESNDV
jgi:hypothetical protein